MQLRSVTRVIPLLLGLVLFIWSCDSFIKDVKEVAPLARVGEAYLYPDELKPYLADGLSPQDSAAFTVNFINNWASKQLLLSKSKINLPEDKLRKFDQLVEDYRTELYTRAYLEALVLAANDTAMTTTELRRFYDDNKDNFKLNEKLVQLRFVVLPNQFLNKNEIVQRLRNLKEEDRSYLDSIAVQFKKIHLKDSAWVSAKELMLEAPAITQSNQDRYLKKSQFFELQDSLGVYLGKVHNVLEVNDIAPFDYSLPEIKRIIINSRRLSYIKKLETEIIDEAIKSNEFEIYEER
ncbi:hypothetical protein [Croceitalea dokdonensis]|uniref:hypothetical protein n=1 Tax=Croceitalea dokdonensis TaxID=346188 RepID=UPI0006CA2271|nr:hypothetical protein [Croceitalea dokdonensis]